MAEEKPKPPSPEQRRWHWTASPEQVGPGTPTYRKRVFKLAAVFMALIGAFLAWLMFWEKVEPPVVLAIPITQYDDPARRWPPNDYAENDYSALRENRHFREQKQEDKQKAFASQNKTTLVGELKSLHTSEGMDRAAVIFLWSLARTDAGGEVFLLPADARPDNPNNWVSLPEILKLVEACSAKHKLLVLDIARPMADPRLGILMNDVADRVAATLEARADLPFFVLTSCGPGQVSLVAPELGRSVFGYYLDEGLLGQADLYNEAHERDGRVMVSELAAFVNVRTDRWARRHGTFQTPRLYGQAKDFALVRIKSVRPPTLAEPPAYSAKLRAGWEQWHEWLKDETYRLTPGVFRRLEALLLRAEHRLPYDPKKADDELAREFNTLRDSVSQAKTLVPPRPRSLAVLAAGRDRKGLDAIKEDLNQVAAKLETVDEKMRPMELDKARKALARKYKGKEEDVALAVWMLATDELETNPAKRVSQLMELVWASLSALAPSVETLFLERLAELKLGPASTLDSAIRDALQVVTRAESAVIDPRAFTWAPIRDMLKSASRKRIEGELLLFDNDLRKRQEARKSFQEALIAYQTLGEYITTIREGWRCLDRAQLFLPSYVPFLMKALEWDLSENPEKVWLRAAEAVRALDQDLVEAPDDLASRLDRVKVRTAEVKELLAELKLPLAWREIRRLIEDPSEASLHKLDALLELPWFQIDGAEPVASAGDKKKNPIKDRAECWKKRQEMAQQLQNRTLKLDEADNQNLQCTKASEPMDVQSARRREEKRAARRARISLELLKLGAAPDVRALDSDANPDPVTNGNNHWNEVGKELAAAWSRLPEQIEKSIGTDPAAAERLSRVVNPLSPDWPWEPSKGKKNPALQLHQRALAAFCKWLAEDYREKSQRYSGRYQEFYNSAAEVYADAQHRWEKNGQEP
jgi:hypothetical protein